MTNHFMILPLITTPISLSCHAFIPPHTPVINKGKTWLSNLFQIINHSISISQIIRKHLSNLSDSPASSKVNHIPSTPSTSQSRFMSRGECIGDLGNRIKVPYLELRRETTETF